jgi:hypothetical protein
MATVNPSTVRQRLEPLRVAAMVGVDVTSQASEGRLDVGTVVHQRQAELAPGFVGDTALKRPGVDI